MLRQAASSGERGGALGNAPSAIQRERRAHSADGGEEFWSSGSRVSAEGTKWNLHEQNLLSEYHIRYGGYHERSVILSRGSLAQPWTHALSTEDLPFEPLLVRRGR
nr:Tn3 family transposase [Paraburkholderia terrae]MDW3658582.1 Tn3 family transposase [Paraburkholderia terrae]